MANAHINIKCQSFIVKGREWSHSVGKSNAISHVAEKRSLYEET